MDLTHNDDNTPMALTFLPILLFVVGLSIKEMSSLLIIPNTMDFILSYLSAVSFIFSIIIALPKVIKLLTTAFNTLVSKTRKLKRRSKRKNKSL